MFFKKKNPIGLDIGSNYIKAFQLSTTKTGHELAFAAMLPLPPETIVEGAITDKDKLVASLKELMKKSGVKSGDVVAGVSGHSSVIIKKITIPVMSESELATSIRYEAEQYIPFDISDVNLDFQILGNKAGEEGQMDVVLVAVKKNVISDYIEVIERAGLEPVIVDVDSFALNNMYEANYDITGNKNVALVNIGASKTNINILQGGLPIFTRDSAIGGNLHTESLERTLDISREDAERIKKGQAVEGVSPVDAQAALNTASDEIYTEIYRSFEYFRSSVGEEDVSEILLSGGTVMMKDFPSMMAGRLGMQVEVVDPFRNIRISEKLDAAYIKEIAPVVAVSVGLALRREGDRE